LDCKIIGWIIEVQIFSLFVGLGKKKKKKIKKGSKFRPMKNNENEK
jgi:hypothetical protein